MRPLAASLHTRSTDTICGGGSWQGCCLPTGFLSSKIFRCKHTNKKPPEVVGKNSKPLHPRPKQKLFESAAAEMERFSDLVEPSARDPHPEKERAGAGVPTCSPLSPVPEKRKAARGTITTNLWPR